MNSEGQACFWSLAYCFPLLLWSYTHCISTQICLRKLITQGQVIKTANLPVFRKSFIPTSLWGKWLHKHIIFWQILEETGLWIVILWAITFWSSLAKSLSKPLQFRPKNLHEVDLPYSWSNWWTSSCISHRHCNVWFVTTEVEISELIHLKSLKEEEGVRFSRDSDLVC